MRDSAPEETMRAPAIVVVFTALAASSLWPHAVRAQSEPARPAIATAGSIIPIGKVVTTTGSVAIEHVNAAVVQASLGAPVKVGDPVYLGDVVQTAADGKIGVGFTDGTAFNLSSNARMVLNEFVYDPNSKSNSTLFSLTKGTFTFVAGKVAKTGNMKIDTPVATMGIRGTTPRVEISEDGTVKFATLIEEGKDKIADRPGAPKRQAKATLAPSTPADAQPLPAKKIDKPNLIICQGC